MSMVNVALTQEVSVALLNGERVSGVLSFQGPSDANVTGRPDAIFIDGQEYPTSEISSIKFPQSNSSSATDPTRVTLGLQGGTQIRSELVTMNADRWQIDAQFGTELPPKSVRWMLLQEPTEKQRSDWSSILKSEKVNDTIVIQRANDVIDQIEGLVQSVDSERVNFEFQGQTVPAPREKLLGIVLFRSKAERTTPLPIVRLSNGSTLAATTITSTPNDELEVGTASDVRFRLSPSEIVEINYAAANVRWLAECEVLSSRVYGVELDDSLSDLLAALAPRLAPADDALSSGQSLDAGPEWVDLVFDRSGAFETRVPEGFATFEAKVNHNVTGNFVSRLDIVVEQDGKVIFDESFDGNADELDVACKVSPEKRLTLIVRNSSDVEIGTAVRWSQPRFVR